jgi:DNA-directed RNA polymerase specialized sigma24 family protein
MPKSAVQRTAVSSEVLFEIPHKHGHDYACWLVERTADRLIGRGEFAEHEREDLQQDLLLKLLESWPAFDPRKSQPLTFVALVTRNAVSKLVRRRRLERQHVRFVPEPPDVEVPSHVPAVDLQCDVAAVLERLPPELRELAGRLMTDSVKEVARSDGVPLSVIKRQVQQLHDAFAAADVTLEL